MFHLHDNLLPVSGAGAEAGVLCGDVQGTRKGQLQQTPTAFACLSVLRSLADDWWSGTIGGVKKLCREIILQSDGQHTTEIA